MKRTEVTIAMDDQSDFTVRGYEFTVDDVTLVVHRIGPNLGWADHVSKGWSVTEPVTGRAPSTSVHRTRSGACMAAQNLVRAKGAAAFHKAIERHKR